MIVKNGVIFFFDVFKSMSFFIVGYELTNILVLIKHEDCFFCNLL
jgi:hypothetical protein